MAKIIRTCDNCKKLLRKADMHEPDSDKYKKLCSECFYLWLEDKLPK